MSFGTLYIVATPIGNLEDMTFRAVRVLAEVSLIAAEDTRHSRKLLNHYGIRTPLTSYHDHNERLKTDHLLERLAAGDSLALITDAGTPAIADPGFRIVQAAAAAGIRIVPLPGASALVTALSASGLPSDRFAFEGFLPSRQHKRRERLTELATEPRLLVFYEAPHRLADSLADMAAILGDRPAVVARELTKLHEELHRDTLPALARHFQETGARGEMVILVSPADTGSTLNLVDPEQLLRGYLLDQGMSLKEAVARVVAETAISRSKVYASALSLTNITRR
jgi:16S rRNA (cytidine1402-2'-O)-methyltransferase